MLFKISIKYYITIIFSLFSFVNRYAVRNVKIRQYAVRRVKIRQYAVRRVKIRQYAVRKGEGGFHPHLTPDHWLKRVLFCISVFYRWIIWVIMCGCNCTTDNILYFYPQNIRFVKYICKKGWLLWVYVW